MIVLDWEPLAEGSWGGIVGYATAANNTKVVGARAADFIRYIVQQGVTELSRVHFIGHSLGKN